MKNNFSVNFYKAYSEWKSALENDDKYKGYKESLFSKNSGENSLSGVVGNKILDLEWLETIEEALPYMDEAIRQSRSFIEQRDEIVSIEKVKKVNTQSIRHLAQHTNMIAKVEDNGDVKPDRILNIFYESSFAIYENRFLYTLLGKLNDFVEKRYNDLRSKDERIEIKYGINKTVRRKNKLSKMSLEFEYKSQADTRKVDIKEDVSHLSGYDRVLRIRRIISDFYSLTLIKNLRGVELVKPPIIQTNLLTKNVNFRNCVALWDYISRYTKNGYIYENKEYDGKMPKGKDRDLSDVFVFANFLTEITFNSDLKRTLERDYKKQLKEEKEAEKERLRLEEEARKQAEQERLEKILERKTNPLFNKIEKLEERNRKLQYKFETLQYQHETMLKATEDIVNQNRLIEEEQQNILNLQENIRMLETQINLKNQAIVDARHSLNTLRYPTTVEEAEAKIRENRAKEIKAQVQKFQEKREQEIREQILKFQQEKEQEIRDQVQKYQEDRIDELNSLSRRFKNATLPELEEEEEFEEETLQAVEQENANIIEFPTLHEEKSEEDKLRDLIKKLEEQEKQELSNYDENQDEDDEEELDDLIQALKEQMRNKQ